MITADVLIVGAGSSGLFLANLLIKSGVDVLIIDKKTSPGKHSRAIGIHPPGLRLLDELDLLPKFEQSGVKITTGKAFLNKEEVATLKLGSSNPADYIMSIPQQVTESIMRENIPKQKLCWGHEVTDLIQIGNSVVVTATKQSGEIVKFKSVFVVGCDGIKSKIRMLIDAKWVGNTYDYHYTMADFPDNTGFRNMAAIYLSIDGLTESFPLPDKNRRWVVNHLDGEISIQNLIEKIYTRSGFRLSESECTMHSNFRIHEYESTKICDGNIILLGDATHIMSPIGGQAMSLHWIHASRLGKLITQILQKNITEIRFRTLLKAYSFDVQLNGKKYTSRAAFNTKMGLPGKNKYLLNIFVAILAKTPLKSILAKRFAMRDLN